MRTTVNISNELLAEAKVVAAQTRRSLGDVIDDALRVSFTRVANGGQEGWTFPTGGGGGLRPGVNLDDKDALAELLDGDDLS